MNEDRILDAMRAPVSEDLLRKAANLIGGEGITGMFVMSPPQYGRLCRSMYNFISFVPNGPVKPIPPPVEGHLGTPISVNIHMPVDEIHYETSLGRVKIVNLEAPELDPSFSEGRS